MGLLLVAIAFGASSVTLTRPASNAYINGTQNISATVTVDSTDMFNTSHCQFSTTGDGILCFYSLSLLNAGSFMKTSSKYGVIS